MTLVLLATIMLVLIFLILILLLLFLVIVALFLHNRCSSPFGLASLWSIGPLGPLSLASLSTVIQIPEVLLGVLRVRPLTLHHRLLIWVLNPQAVPARPCQAPWAEFVLNLGGNPTAHRFLNGVVVSEVDLHRLGGVTLWLLLKLFLLIWLRLILNCFPGSRTIYWFYL